MPRWDYRCDECGYTQEVTAGNYKDLILVAIYCPTCDVLLRRQPSAPNFSVEGYNAGNGYSDTTKR